MEQKQRQMVLKLKTRFNDELWKKEGPLVCQAVKPRFCAITETSIVCEITALIREWSLPEKQVRSLISCR